MRPIADDLIGAYVGTCISNGICTHLLMFRKAFPMDLWHSVYCQVHEDFMRDDK